MEEKNQRGPVVDLLLKLVPESRRLYQNNIVNQVLVSMNFYFSLFGLHLLIFFLNCVQFMQNNIENVRNPDLMSSLGSGALGGIQQFLKNKGAVRVTVRKLAVDSDIISQHS